MSVSSEHRFATIFSLCLVIGFSTSQLRAQTAQHEITFEATWHSSTHPYPNGAHFHAHRSHAQWRRGIFWRAGGMATPGIERMAEAGSVSPLIKNELGCRRQRIHHFRWGLEFTGQHVVHI